MSFLKKEGGAGGSQTGVSNTPNTKKKKKKKCWPESCPLYLPHNTCGGNRNAIFSCTFMGFTSPFFKY